MGELGTIIIVAGITIPFYLIFKDPKEYFDGLLKSVYEKKKTKGFHLYVVIFSVIAIPLVYLFKMPWETMDVIAAVLMGTAFIWKSYEIFKSPKAYFTGLFKKYDDPERTSSEPISLFLMSLVVLVAYFSQLI